MQNRKAFRGGHRIPLTAQVALAEAQTKTQTRIDQLAAAQAHMDQKVAETTDKLGAAQARIEQNLSEATDKLDALIDLMTVTSANRETSRGKPTNKPPRFRLKR